MDATEENENAFKINTSVVLCNKKTKTLLPSRLKYLKLDISEAFWSFYQSLERKRVWEINTKDKQKCIWENLFPFKLLHQYLV